ncbi:sigma-70 family RNA polymerase sigma factor [Ramlibacter henchirensis]|nr:sigma-70 family RNA polymerase sigma factor [Ramlibacter henchirensis]
MSHRNDEEATRLAPATLGDVLYGAPHDSLVTERSWVDLVESVAARNQLALHALYERAHRVVFTLAMRITGSRETAEELTLDVFHDVWRHAASFDPANGTVLGWIMNHARSRSIDRLRFRNRSALNGLAPAPVPEAAESPAPVEREQQSESLQRALSQLGQGEREAIEAAFFSELSYAEVADRLNQPVDTIKTSIRSGLHKLREALGAESRPA